MAGSHRADRVIGARQIDRYHARMPELLGRAMHRAALRLAGALLTRISMGPKVCAACSNARRVLAASVISAATACAEFDRAIRGTWFNWLDGPRQQRHTGALGGQSGRDGRADAAARARDRRMLPRERPRPPSNRSDRKRGACRDCVPTAPCRRDRARATTAPRSAAPRPHAASRRNRRDAAARWRIDRRAPHRRWC